MLAKVGSKSMHSIFPNEQKWLLMLSYINAHGKSIPNFYIFKGKQFKRNYIERCENGFTMAMQPCAWMITCLSSTWIFHFITTMQVCRGNMSLENKHLLIIDSHNSHVIIGTIKTIRKVGLAWSLCHRISHTLQSLDVSCFKPFKTTFWAYRMFGH